MESGTEAAPLPATRTRRVASFSWASVDPELVRSICGAVYAERQDEDNLKRLQLMSGSAAARNAERLFGRYPPSAPARLRPIVIVLLEQWVPTLTTDELRSLTTQLLRQSGPEVSWARKATKQQMVKWLGQRRRTESFLLSLRRAFMAVHKEHREVPVHDASHRDSDSGVVDVFGYGEPRQHELYPHQAQAVRALKDLPNGSPPSGIVVLPTGAGKTEAALEWLLDEMLADPELRVLWLAHQQELVSQAVTRLQQSGRSRPRSFQRRARQIHAAADTINVLAEPDLDFIGATIQSIGGRWNAKKRRLLEEFCRRPLILVVDEAHHAASPTYRQVLDAVPSEQVRALVGLTATPGPTSLQARFDLRDRFGDRPIFEVGLTELVTTRILARPVLHTVSTHQLVTMSPEERQQAIASDLAPSVLRRLDNTTRNELVTATYRDGAADWGKTLVFAADIEHADILGGYLKRVAPGRVRVLHSRSGDRAEDLGWFKSESGQAVLVSVGMLTEGIDLPDATSAFLCRPTTSRVLLKQMVGRVLRGPAAGGGHEAHVVNFRDEWPYFADTLLPEEALPQLRPAASASVTAETALPEVVDDMGDVIDLDVVATVKREYETARPPAQEWDVDYGGSTESVLDPVLVPSRLIGYWDLPDMKVPVFEHQMAGFEALMTASAESKERRIRPFAFFEGTFPPYPSARMLRSIVDFVRVESTEPPFVDVRASIDPWLVAERIVKHGAMTELERAGLIQRSYESSLARAAYPSLERFEEAVEQAGRTIRARAAGRAVRSEPERLLTTASGQPPLPRAPDRSLGPAWALVLERLPGLVQDERASRFQPETEYHWTPHVVSTTLAHWSLQSKGRYAFRDEIRVNLLLQTKPELISDEVLAYLLYHEVLHGILVGQGHSSEFRDLESRWEGFSKLDLFLDTLPEHWDLRPESYQSPSSPLRAVRSSQGPRSR